MIFSSFASSGFYHLSSLLWLKNCWLLRNSPVLSTNKISVMSSNSSPQKSSVAPISYHQWLKLLPVPFYPFITAQNHLTYKAHFQSYPPITLVLITLSTYEDTRIILEPMPFTFFFFYPKYFPSITSSSVFFPCMHTKIYVYSRNSATWHFGKVH